MSKDKKKQKNIDEKYLEVNLPLDEKRKKDILREYDGEIIFFKETLFGGEIYRKGILKYNEKNSNSYEMIWERIDGERIKEKFSLNNLEKFLIKVG